MNKQEHLIELDTKASVYGCPLNKFQISFILIQHSFKMVTKIVDKICVLNLFNLCVLGETIQNKHDDYFH